MQLHRIISPTQCQWHWCKKNKSQLPTVQHQHSEHPLKHPMPSNQKGESEEQHLKNNIAAYHNAGKWCQKYSWALQRTDAERWRSFWLSKLWFTLVFNCEKHNDNCGGKTMQVCIANVTASHKTWFHSTWFTQHMIYAGHDLHSTWLETEWMHTCTEALLNWSSPSTFP